MNDAAAIRVFEGHRLAVYRWALRVLGRHHDALDVTQDVGLRWLVQCRRSAPDQPRSWLRRVTLNRATDFLRRRASGPGVERAELNHVAAPGLDDPLVRQEFRLRVARALRDLSDMQRQVLVAKLWDGLTFAQVARELGISTPTAKTHYVRALGSVRTKLGDWLQPSRGEP